MLYVRHLHYSEEQATSLTMTSSKSLVRKPSTNSGMSGGIPSADMFSSTRRAQQRNPIEKHIDSTIRPTYRLRISTLFHIALRRLSLTALSLTASLTLNSISNGLGPNRRVGRDSGSLLGGAAVGVCQRGGTGPTQANRRRIPSGGA